jgi:membrane protease YdiL (CAAX protease family)
MTSTAAQTAQPHVQIRPSRLRSTALRQSLLFLGLVYAMVLAVALTLSHAAFAPLPSMVTPVVAVALITFLGTPRGQRRALWASVGLRHLGLRSWPVAFFASVLIILVVPYGVAALLGSVTWVSVPSYGWLGWGLNLVTGLAVVTLLALTEEIGWRGYLLPRVQTLVSRRWAAVVVGFVHGLFHLPLILLTQSYDSVGSRWIVAPVVVATITAGGVLYAWLKDRSGSVWPVAFAHAAVNTLLEGAGLVTVVSPLALAYTAGESGLVTLAAVIAFAAVLLVRGGTFRR